MIDWIRTRCGAKRVEARYHLIGVLVTQCDVVVDGGKWIEGETGKGKFQLAAIDGGNGSGAGGAASAGGAVLKGSGDAGGASPDWGGAVVRGGGGRHFLCSRDGSMASLH